MGECGGAAGNPSYSVGWGGAGWGGEDKIRKCNREMVMGEFGNMLWCF